ncbi:MAG: TetR/AcrR family transcriptional regulator [Clostridiales bacterium]|nr:TetR/AcrR family transcriptional regulator [Clostridiales bacterium]
MQVLKDDIRNSILEASLDEFYKNGYEKASMSGVAKRCAISKSNMYNYFPSKKSIYDALTAPAIAEITKTTRELTKKRCESHTCDEVALEFTESLQHVICKYRKEIVVILTGSPDQEERMIQDMLQHELVECFMSLDESRISRGFLEVLASMLLDGLCKIIIQSDSNEEIPGKLYALFQYHIHGIQPFRKK